MRVDVLEQALFAPSDEKWCRAMTPTVEVKGLEPSAYGLQSRRSSS
jgi:hypothetical protein